MKQEPDQTIDALLQQLKTKPKRATFKLWPLKKKTKNKKKKQYRRDAFINGITSTSIRRCLKEKKLPLSLQEVYEIAGSLEQAEKQSAHEQGNIIIAPIISSEENTSLATIKTIGLKKFAYFLETYTIRIIYVRPGNLTVKKKSPPPNDVGSRYVDLQYFLFYMTLALAFRISLD